MPDTVVQPVEERTAPPSRQIAKPPRSNTPLIVLVLLFSILGTGMGGTALWLTLRPEPEPEVEEIVEEIVEEYVEVEGVDFLRFNDQYVGILSDLPTNDYDQEAFSLVDDRILYENAQLGIDVSQYQGEVDWQAVADDGVSFAIIRVGYRGYGEEGKIVLDERFHENIVGAQAAGLEVGVYFFSQATSVWEAKEEALFVLEELSGYTLELPVYYDWEFITYSSSARTNGTMGRSLTLYTQMFCEEITAGGYTPAVYFNQTLGYLYLDLMDLSDYSFWLASYRDAPNFFYHFDIWQYSEQGTVAGIEGDVDLNLMFAQDALV